MTASDKLDAKTVRDLERFLRDSLATVRLAVRERVVQRRATEGERSPDIGMQAAETLHDEIQTTLVDRQARQAKLIEDALDRLTRGEYGYCRRCGSFVGLARLRALPFAQRCRDCQGQVELNAAA